MSIAARLSRLFTRQPLHTVASPSTSALHVVQPPGDLADVPKYPPYNPGLPAVAPDRIVATQSELIARIRSAAPVSDTDFEKTYMAAIRSYAAFVHLLPASEAHHHRGTGGLFRHGLEAALYGALHSDRMMFALDEPAARRRVLEPIWRFAAFLCALNHDIGKPLSDVGVLDLSGAHEWNPFACSLSDWAQQNAISHYVIRFRPGRHQDHEMLGVLALEQVVSSGVKQYLAQAGPKLLSWVVSAIANAQSAETINPFRDLVIRADKDSVERDLRINGALQSNLPAVGVASERYVLDAMRRLLRNREWKVNCKGARVWLIEGNLYVSWAAARDIVRLITSDKTPGVPRDPDSIADMLIERGLAVARESFHGARRYWWITPDLLEGVTLKTVRIASPDLLLDPPPASVTGRVLNADGPDQDGDEPHLDKPASESGSVTPIAAPEQPASVPVKMAPEPIATATQQLAPVTPSSVPPPSAAAAVVCQLSEPRPPDPGARSAADAPSTADATPKAATKQSANPFEGKGILSEIVATLIDDIANGVRAPDQVRQESGLVVLAWPESFQGFGMDPRAALKIFESAGIAEADPSMPTRLVRDGVEGKKIVVLRHREGMALLGLLAKAPRRATVTDSPECPEPRPPTATAAPSPTTTSSKAAPADDPISHFIRFYRDPGVTTPFSVTRKEDGTISLPFTLAIAHYVRNTGLKQPEVKASVIAESEQTKRRLTLAAVRNTQRIEIPPR